MSSKTAAIIASLAAMAYLALPPAAVAMDQGFYVGGYYGKLDRDADEDEELAGYLANSLLAYDQLLLTPLEVDPRYDVRDKSYGFVAGFRWLPNLAFELGFVQLGELRYHSEDVVALEEDPTVVFATRSSLKTELSAFTLSALGVWPLTYAWEIYGRAGLAITSSDFVIRVATEDDAIAAGDTQDSVDWLAGAGLSYTFLDVYTARAEIQRVFDAGHEDAGPEADVDLISLSIVVTF